MNGPIRSLQIRRTGQQKPAPGAAKVLVAGERLPAPVFRVFLPESNPPRVCGVDEVGWERRMPGACEFGLAPRAATSHYRDRIHELCRVGRERVAAPSL